MFNDMLSEGPVDCHDPTVADERRFGRFTRRSIRLFITFAICFAKHVDKMKLNSADLGRDWKWTSFAHGHDVDRDSHGQLCRFKVGVPNADVGEIRSTVSAFPLKLALDLGFRPFAICGELLDDTAQGVQ